MLTALALGAVVWLAVGLLVAVGIGRSIRLADERRPGTGLSAVLGNPAPGSAG